MAFDPGAILQVQANCRIIWGNDNYELDIETDDYEDGYCTVRKDYGDHFGDCLAMTGLCNSAEDAENMGSTGTNLEIFGGLRVGGDRGVLEAVVRELDKRVEEEEGEEEGKKKVVGLEVELGEGAYA
ncbi:hypothetical protein DSL72_002446 [Monilinia vaccinii-corymbosi]|uniref:Uncharacterized protein n=1 Tax=Monilinia vaccinii-corymbosi TaxID=61207 RepID=A0A8A3PCP2_9HELO|nr:hypothetical protein DSL72_002446 [Monilinia vaccinii-corymbosi]